MSKNGVTEKEKKIDEETTIIEADTETLAHISELSEGLSNLAIFSKDQENVVKNSEDNTDSEKSEWSDDEEVILKEKEKVTQDLLEYKTLRDHAIPEKYDLLVVLKLQLLFQYFANFEDPELFISTSSQVFIGAFLQRLIKGNPWEARDNSEELAKLIAFVNEKLVWIESRESYLDFSKMWAALFLQSFKYGQFFDLKHLDIREACNIFKEELRDILDTYARNLYLNDVITLKLYQTELRKLTARHRHPHEYHFLGLNPSLLEVTLISFIGQLVKSEQHDVAKAIHNFFYLITSWVDKRSSDESVEENLKIILEKNVAKALMNGLQLKDFIFEKREESKYCEISLMRKLLEHATTEMKIFRVAFDPAIYKNSFQPGHKANVLRNLRIIDIGRAPVKNRSSKRLSSTIHFKKSRDYRVPIRPFKAILSEETLDKLLGDNKEAKLVFAKIDSLTESAELQFLERKAFTPGYNTGKHINIETLYDRNDDKKKKEKEKNDKVEKNPAEKGKNRKKDDKKDDKMKRKSSFT